MRGRSTHESTGGAKEGMAGGNAAVEKPVSELEAVSPKKLNWLKDTDPFLRKAVRRLVPRDAYMKITRSSLAELKSRYMNSPYDLCRLILMDDDIPPRDFDAYIAEMVSDEDPVFKELLTKQMEMKLGEEIHSKLASSLLKNMLEEITGEKFERNKRKHIPPDLRQKLIAEDMQRALIDQLRNYDRIEYPNSTMRALLSECLPQATSFLAGSGKIENKVRPQLLMRAENAETRLEALQTFGRHWEGTLMSAVVFERLVHDEDAAVRFEAQMILLEHHLDSLRDPEDETAIETEESVKFFDWIKSLPTGEAATICKGLAQRKRETRVFLANNLHHLGERKELWETAMRLLNDEYEEVHSAMTATLPNIPSGRLKTALISNIVCGFDQELKIDLLKKIHIMEMWMAPEVFMDLAKDEDRDVREAVERYLYRLSKCDQREVEKTLAIMPLSS